MSKLYIASTILALAVLLNVAWYAYSRINTDKEPIRIDQAVFTTTKPTLKRYNIYSKPTSPTKPTSDEPVAQDWVHSTNIKHTPYVPKYQASAQPSTTTKPTDSTSPEVGANDEVFDIWSWLPTGRSDFNTKIAKIENGDNKVENLRSYTNAFGRRIKTAIAELGDQNLIMKEFVDGRGTPGNKEAIVGLGQGYITLATSLETLEQPVELRQNASALIRAYREVGDYTLELSRVTTDEETLSAINAYNSIVENFVIRFMALSNTLGAYGVRFTTGEGGDIFMPRL